MKNIKHTIIMEYMCTTATHIYNNNKKTSNLNSRIITTLLEHIILQHLMETYFFIGVQLEE